ncbi:CBS domain-containing protein [Desulfoluna limicola]|nr:CBS domain-containing protein [Desulfoluna limicola]
MSVQKIMSKRIVTVELDDTLAVARDIFENVKFHHLLVVENNKLFGVLSDRDLLKALSPNLETAAENRQDRATLNKRVHQVMSRKPITLNENASVYDAIHLFNTEIITCIPIVDNDNRPVGIISWRDIMKMLGKMIKEKSDKT